MRSYSSIIGIIISDINALSTGRKGHNLVLSLAIKLYHERSQILQVDGIFPSQVINLTVSLIGTGSQKHGFNNIVHIIEIPYLQTIPENLNGFTFN